MLIEAQVPWEKVKDRDERFGVETRRKKEIHQDADGCWKGNQIVSKEHESERWMTSMRYENTRQVNNSNCANIPKKCISRKNMFPRTTKHQLVKSIWLGDAQEGLEESKSRPDISLASLSTLTPSGKDREQLQLLYLKRLLFLTRETFLHFKFQHIE